MSKPTTHVAAAGLALLALVVLGGSSRGREEHRHGYDTDVLHSGRGVHRDTSPFARGRTERADPRLASTPEDRAWSDRFGRPGFDDEVFALAVYNGSLIAGGDFTLSDSTGVDHVARWNGSRWEPLGTGLGPSCLGWRAVSAFADYNGDLAVGGSFIIADTDTVNGLARWNGVAWTGIGGGVWNAPAPESECARVRALISFQGQLVVGGSFDHAGGMAIHNLAQWNGTSWSRMGSGFMGEVWALAIHDGALVAAVDFYNTGQTQLQGVLQWDGNEWHPLGLGPEGQVLALVEYRGDLIAAGGFTTAGGLPTARIARWDGSLWQPLGSGIEGEEYFAYVEALGVYDDKLFVGGRFTHAGGVPVSAIAIWDGAAWSSAGDGLQTGFLDEDVYALVPFDGQMVAGGNFARSGDAQADFIARWNGTTWSGMGSPGLGADGIIYAAVPHGGGLIVAGSFGQVGPVRAESIARWDGSNWQAMDRGFAAESTWVSAIASSGTDLYASRAHVRAYMDTTGSQVLRWDGEAWQTLGPPIDQYIGCLAVYQGNVVAAGRFSRAGGTPANNIARWDGSSWQPLGRGILGEYPEVRDLQVYRGDLIAAGTFTWAGDNTADNIARWDGTSWHRLGAGLTGVIFANVYDLELYAGNLVAVGEFNGSGDVPAGSVAAWDGSRWSALGSGIPGDWDLPQTVFCAAAAGSHLFVGGWFEHAGDVPAHNIAHWDGSTWTGMGSGLNDVPLGVRFFQNTLCAGGWFTAAGAKRSAHFAVWSDPAVPVEVSDLEAALEGGNVRLAWRLSSASVREAQGVRVERASTTAGPFVERTPAPLVPAARMQFTDAEVHAGEEYWYRIVLERPGDERTVTAAMPVRVAAPGSFRTRLEGVIAADPRALVRIRYSVGPAPERLALAVYDVRGREVWSRPAEVHAPGAYTVAWDRVGTDRRRAGRGIYFVKLTAQRTSYSARLVLLQP
jgi:trimeric autotransporter adhesin